jgi:hypothetical protein
MSLSNLRKAADVLKVGTGRLFSKAFSKITRTDNLSGAD